MKKNLGYCYGVYTLHSTASGSHVWGYFMTLLTANKIVTTIPPCCHRCFDKYMGRRANLIFLILAERLSLCMQQYLKLKYFCSFSNLLHTLLFIDIVITVHHFQHSLLDPESVKSINVNKKVKLSP